MSLCIDECLAALDSLERDPNFQFLRRTEKYQLKQIFVMLVKLDLGSLENRDPQTSEYVQLVRFDID